MLPYFGYLLLKAVTHPTHTCTVGNRNPNAPMTPQALLCRSKTFNLVELIIQKRTTQRGKGPGFSGSDWLRVM